MSEVRDEQSFRLEAARSIRSKLDARGLKGWLYSTSPSLPYPISAIQTSYTFSDFGQALGFLVSIGTIAAELNHHPELTISNTRLSVVLTSYDEGGVTDKDFFMAQRIDNLIRQSISNLKEWERA